MAKHLEETVKYSRPYLSIRQVSFSYSFDLHLSNLPVNDVSIAVEQGDCFALLGPNGAGKTTLMSIIAGIEKKFTGQVEIGGFDVRDRSCRSLVGYVPQDLAVYPQLTGRENLEFFAGLLSISKKRRYKLIDDVLTKVGLIDHSDSRAGVYSGGMKRRLNLSIALLGDPVLLILDEPTVGVDPQSRSLIFELLEKLNRQGTTIIYSTHYMEEVTRLCRHMAIMDHGKVVAQGAVVDFLASIGESLIETEVDGPLGNIEKAAKTMGLEYRINSLKPNRPTVAFKSKNLGLEITAICSSFAQNGVSVVAINSRRSSLEDYFLALTGRMLRD